MPNLQKLVAAAVSHDQANATLAAASVDVDDGTADPSNGDCTAVSFRPAPAAAASSSSASVRSQLFRSTSGDSDVRQAAVASLGNNDAQRPTAEVTSAPASSAAEDEERKSLLNVVV